MRLSRIQGKVYEIRGRKIMLDFDPAEMDEVETGALKQAVKRNQSRFLKDFMFPLPAKEMKTWHRKI